MQKNGPDIRQYLERIRYSGPTTPTMDTFRAIHAAHAVSVPFENIDVQLGRAVSTHVHVAFEKIVVRKRGGWCYEQNGLFGWALAEVGFDVARIAASVMRQQTGEVSRASHLCLVVNAPGLKHPFLADVGFGGSMIAPIPLIEARHLQAPFELALEKTADGYWRFSEDSGEGRFGYDFQAVKARESQLKQKCDYLQSDPASTFVLNLVAQRRFPDCHRVLRGRVLSTVAATGIESFELQSATELVSILKGEFLLDVPGVGDLWPKIVARHRELFD